jgi:hypothetical protein
MFRGSTPWVLGLLIHGLAFEKDRAHIVQKGNIYCQAFESWVDGLLLQ